jgi:hypothetical protein
MHVLTPRREMALVAIFHLPLYIADDRFALQKHAIEGRGINYHIFTKLLAQGHLENM